MRLENKIAIITGAAGGMGQAAAILFAREGARVALVDLTETSLDATMRQVAEDGGTAIAIGADISRTDDVKHILADTVARLGVPNILFNNAGVDTEGKRRLLDVAEEDFDRAIEVNLKGTWLMIKYIAPAMIEGGGGSIINTASIAPFVSCATVGYSAAKAGVVTMSKIAAVELGRHNIRVNALCPGATETPMAVTERAKMKALGLPTSEAIIGRISTLGRLGLPVEMANMALFLASDESSFATGGVFVNDGGWTAMSGIEMASQAAAE